MPDESYPQRPGAFQLAGMPPVPRTDLGARAPEILDEWAIPPPDHGECKHLWALEAGVLRCYHCHWRYQAILNEGASNATQGPII